MRRGGFVGCWSGGWRFWRGWRWLVLNFFFFGFGFGSRLRCSCLIFFVFGLLGLQCKGGREGELRGISGLICGCVCIGLSELSAQTIGASTGVNVKVGPEEDVGRVEAFAWYRLYILFPLSVHGEAGQST